MIVSSEVVDALVEAMVFSVVPEARAAVLCSLVQKLCATAEWLRGSEIAMCRVTDEELLSPVTVVSGVTGWEGLGATTVP